MKQINKLPEPDSLVQHRSKSSANFDNIPIETKEELRGNLLEEQGYICCYCMKRIPEKMNKDGENSYKMKVEHYKCQNRFPELQLDYKNLFGACTGNEGQPKKLQTCDTKKANEELTINPLTTSPSCETLFKFNSEGEMSSLCDDESINNQINKVLNLNMQSLMDTRKEVYFFIQARVRAESNRAIRNKAAFKRFLNQELQFWQAKDDKGKYKPYCMVAIYYLKKKLRKL